MSDKKDKKPAEIKRQEHHRIDESRDISKMQAPEKWPDPPPDTTDKKQENNK